MFSSSIEQRETQSHIQSSFDEHDRFVRMYMVRLEGIFFPRVHNITDKTSTIIRLKKNLSKLHIDRHNLHVHR
jgi:hypothetical protein